MFSPIRNHSAELAFTGHTHIDLLKIDIEGWEFETLANLLKPYIDSGKPLPFGQLSMEIHLWDRSFESIPWLVGDAGGSRVFDLSGLNPT
jgi:hypothetical protein